MSDDGGADAGDSDTSSGPSSSTERDGDASSGSRSETHFSRADEAVLADPATVQAYDEGRFLLDPTVIAGRDVHITVQTFARGGPEPVETPGPVSDDQLDTLRSTYAPVSGYGDLLALLRKRRLLVLVGAGSSGRTTTALHLLDEVSDGAVSRFDPGTDPTARTDLAALQWDEGSGYVGEIDVSDSEQARVGADRLAALLERRGAYCVLVSQPSPIVRQALDRYRVDCPVVEPMDMLENHLRAGLTAEDDLDDDWVTELLDRDDITRLIGRAAQPAQVAEIAALLLGNGRNGITPELRARTEQILFDQRFEEWFAALGGLLPGVRGRRVRQLTAMRIAVAVFDGMPRHIAVAAADDLAAHLESPHPPPRTSSDADPPRNLRGPTRLLDPDEARSLASSSSIRIEQRGVPEGNGLVPGEVIRYGDPRMPVALLKWVWLTQYALREPIIAWLDGLSRERRGHVRLRAAQAAGLLCTADYTHTMLNLVEPAAKARPDIAPSSAVVDPEAADADEDGQLDVAWFRHQFAAVAMDHAARDPALRGAVRKRLTRWRRSTNTALRWTTAIALGFDVGARDINRTLDELRVLGTPEEADRFRRIEQYDLDGRRRDFAFRHEWQVYQAAGSGVTWLFRIGAHRQVLDELEYWMDHPRTSVRELAWLSVVYLMDVRVAAIGSPINDGAARTETLITDDDRSSRKGWPVLLALHAGDRPLAGASAALVRQTLRSRYRELALRVLKKWIELAAEDDEALPTVETALTRLVEDEGDRARLRGLVRHMQHRWEDPLDEDVAARLDDLLEDMSLDHGRKVPV